MASNSFGKIFKIMTWGESHGKAIGVVIDGCPAGIELSEEEILQELLIRRGGRNPYVSPRAEKDKPQILSGVFEGKTTGTPISIIIANSDIDSSTYEPIKDLLRPGHANFTYLEKYGVFDYRGGGRASARETACRVAAGAVAKKLLLHYNIRIIAYIKEIGGIVANEIDTSDLSLLKKSILKSPLLCPDEKATLAMTKKIDETKKEGDSLGGVVELITSPLPTGLGDPIYEKLSANLAKSMLSLPAAKGFEIGSGFMALRMKGSEHNDLFECDDNEKVVSQTNHAGGILGGISTGLPLLLRVAFKPTSTILKSQQTLNSKKEKRELQMLKRSKHDPCVAIRAVAGVEAMAALVLADALLMHRASRL